MQFIEYVERATDRKQRSSARPAAYRQILKAQNDQICLAIPNGNVKSAFVMSGFSALFKMANSLDAALSQRA